MTEPVDVHVVAHTHWDREWYLTYEQFRLRLVDLVDGVLDRMTADPAFRYYHLDGQTIVLEDYLELRPERREDLRRLIAEGRLLVGPWYDMPDEFLVSGEALVRNLALGDRLARRFGEPMPVGYLPDLFGHAAQMPQILSQMGLDNAVLWRGFGGPRAEYWWEGPDGSRVLLLHLPSQGYCNAVRMAFAPGERLERATAVARREADRSLVRRALLMNGVDHVEPPPGLLEAIDQLASQDGMRASLSTLPAYVASVREAIQRDDLAASLETVKGELRDGEDYAPLLTGVLSARVYLKQWNARVQTALERWAEPASVFAWLTGAPYPAAALGHAWKLLLQNHPHDSICGCSIDAVHDECVTRFERSSQVADDLTARAMERISRAVEPPTQGRVRCLVFNTDAQPSSGIVEAVVDLPFESAEPGRHVDPEALDAPVRFFSNATHVAAVTDPEGGNVPFQPLGEEEVVTYVMSRYETPWALKARRLRLLWPARVPPCGYAAYDLTLAETRQMPPPAASAAALQPAAGQVSSADERSAENEHVRIVVNEDGTVDVVEKESGSRFERCGALENDGDVGDEYNYSPPARDRLMTSSGAPPARIVRTVAGPLSARFEIQQMLSVPAEATSDRAARSDDLVPMPVTIEVRLDAGSPRVAWRVAVRNEARDHRLRIAFPTGGGADTACADTAFGLVRRAARKPVPESVRIEVPSSTFPMISLVSAGRAIVYGRGLMEYEVTSPQTLAITLLRCVGHLSREDLVTRPGGHAGPGLATPGAQCPGRHTFELAFEPQPSAPDEASLVPRALTFTAPPRVATSAAPSGSLPPRLSFFDVQPGGPAVLSACKRADDRDSVILRFFNPSPADAAVLVRPHARMAQAFAVDLLERRQRELPQAEGAIQVSLGANKILTVELTIDDCVAIGGLTTSDCQHERSPELPSPQFALSPDP